MYLVFLISIYYKQILGFVIFFLASEACKVLLTNGFLQQQAIFVMCKVSCLVDIHGFHIKS